LPYPGRSEQRPYAVGVGRLRDEVDSGVRILVVAIHYPVCSGRYTVDALKRLGHDVRSIGPCTGRDIWGIQVDARYVWQPDGGLAAWWDDWRPDLIILADSAFQYHHPVYNDVPHVVWGVDSHVRDYRQPGIARYFLAHKAACLAPWQGDMEHVPCAYDPAWFTPGPAWDERPYDVAMIGVMYGPRAELINLLLETLPGRRVVYGSGVIYDQYAAIYRRARISLVRSAAGDVAQRVWETAAMGCLVVMDECPDGAALGLVDGENCLMYAAGDEMVDKVSLALSHPLEAQKTALAGQRWASAGTWDARLNQIVAWAQSER
jgi:hypothetical protein